MSNIKFAVLRVNETPVQSLVKDSITFGWLLTCMLLSVYLEHWFWSGIIILMFLISMVAHIGRVLKNSDKNHFYTKAALLKWVNSLEDLNES